MVSFTTVLAFAGIVSAHFHLNYPFWRGDSLTLAATNDSITQWNYPCAGIGQTNSTNNRTAWPLDGGSIQFAGSHPWAYTYVNMGLGETVTSFNISLVEGFNQTGNGSFCFNKVAFSAAANKAQPIQDGDRASIQVIQISHSGASLFNCADIIFRSNATLLSGDQCKNATGVGGVALQNAATASGNSTSGTTTSGARSAKEMTVGMVVGGLAVAFAGLM